MFYKAVCLFFREDITGGLMALRKVIPGGDTYMNLGLEMVRLGLRAQYAGEVSLNYAI